MCCTVCMLDLTPCKLKKSRKLVKPELIYLDSSQPGPHLNHLNIQAEKMEPCFHTCFRFGRKSYFCVATDSRIVANYEMVEQILKYFHHNLNKHPPFPNNIVLTHHMIPVSKSPCEMFACTLCSHACVAQQSSDQSPRSPGTRTRIAPLQPASSNP